MRVFVTGATGVLGRRAVPLLLELGHEVTAVGRTVEKRRALERFGAQAVDVDLFDRAAVRRALVGMEAVCNLATAVPPGFRSFLPWAWGPMDRIRREVSRHLVDGALAGDSLRRLVQEAFAPIYADVVTVGSRFDARRPGRYNRAVLDAEAQATRFTHAGGWASCCASACCTGPATGSRARWWTRSAGMVPVPGRAEGYISWVTQDDAAAAVVAALEAPAGIYNVVDDLPLRRRELADGSRG